MKDFFLGLSLGLFLLAIVPIIDGQAADDTEQRVKTIYDADGRPVNQAIDSKGWHQVTGQVKLASGRSTVTLNTSTADGKQDVSFRDSSTYRGSAWSLDTSNAYTYRVIPLSGARFQIRSSEPTDTATVRYRVEGE